MPKVLVTGGSGFIGTNLINKLKEEGYEVVNLSNHEPTDLKIDLTKDDLSQLDDHEFDYVVHLAAVSSIKLAQGNEDETIEINLDGTKKLLDYFSTKPLKKFIFMSSMTVYECEESGEIPEDNILVGEGCNAYSYSKLLAEEECEKYEEKIPLLILRLANAYGPYQRVGKTPNLIPQVVSQALKDGKVEIYNGEFSRDFVYVSDVVDAVLAGMESEFLGTLNLGTGKGTTVKEITDIVKQELEVEVVDLKRKIDAPLELVPNITRIKEHLNWKPKVQLAEGMKKTIKYYQNAKPEDLQ